ncbi:MAG TPA: phage holin family protein [Kofleriaceae bacterium]
MVTATPPESDPDHVEPEPSFTELLGELSVEVATLVRDEVARAASEMAEKAHRAGRNALLVGVGILLGAVSLLVVAFGLVLVLGSVLPMWLSAFAIAGLIGAFGYVAFRRGSSALRPMDLLPTETFESIQEDGTLVKREIEATRDQMSSTFGEVRKRLTLPAKKPRRAAAKAPAKRKRATKTE